MTDLKTNGHIDCAHTERSTHISTNTQTYDTQIDRHTKTNLQINTQTDKHDGQTYRQSQTEKYTYRHITYIQSDIWADAHRDKHTHRKTYIETFRHTD